MPESREIPSQPADPGHSYPPTTLPVPNPTLPFWLMDPDEFLVDHHTTKELPQYVDRVIVGSGITGASAARYWSLEDSVEGELDGQGYETRILMLEAREACSGATGRNGGHLQPLLYTTTPDIGRFELANCAEVATFIDTDSIACEYRSLTSCHSYWTRELSAKAHASLAQLQLVAPDVAQHVQWIASEQQFADAGLQPCGPKGGTLTTGAASLWPYKYVAATLRKLVRDGKVNLQTNTPVTALAPIDVNSPAPPFARTTTSNYPRARYALQTPRGIVLAHSVLLATNAYTSHLVPCMAPLIVPIRETMTAQIPPPALSKTQLKHSHGFVGIGTSNKQPNPNSTEYLHQRPHTAPPPNTAIRGTGHLMLGGGRISAGVLPHVGVADDSVVDEHVVSFLARLLPHTLLRLGGSSDSEDEAKVGAAALPLEQAWSGIYAQSRDGAPWVGRVPDWPVGAWMCGAYSGHGMPNATLCAKAVVKMMMRSSSVEDGNDDDEKEEEVALMEQMVRDGEIPRSYLITPKRLERARNMPGVEELDRLGIDALEWQLGGTVTSNQRF